jgi:hypothetical protein
MNPRGATAAFGALDDLIAPLRAILDGNKCLACGHACTSYWMQSGGAELPCPACGAPNLGDDEP